MFLLIHLKNMKKLKTILISLFVFIIPSSLSGTDFLISDDCKFSVPFGGDRRGDYSELRNRIIGKYGDDRISYVRGHKHSGIDIKGDFSETVYSIGEGEVIGIFRNFPHKTIYIRHSIGLNIPIFSVYMHVEDVRVHVGELVTKKTPIARIFNREELKAANFGTPPHLHFEIRHNISDNGEATFKSMSIRDLNNYCMDPLEFFKKILKKRNTSN